MSRRIIASLSVGLWALVAATCVYANGVFQSVTGDVRAALGTATPASVARDQRVVAGTTITTGPGGQAIVRLDDGSAVVLHENTEFRINEFSFDKDKPQSDNIALQLLKGAMRSVTGLIGSRNQSKFALYTVQATIGIRGTDFMVALVNPVYLSVIQGAISAANTAGTVAFGVGATATVASATALAVAIPAAALPAAVSATFSSLGSVTVGAAGAAGAASGGTGAGGASGAAAGGLGAGGVAAAAAVVGVAAAAISNANKSDDVAATTGSTTGTP